MNKKLYISILFSLSICFSALGQNPEKGFKDLEKNDIEKAFEVFQKIIQEDSTNCAAQFGFSLVLSNDSYKGFDIFSAWDHFLLANKYFSSLTEKDNIYLKDFFALRDPERRNKPIRFNFDIEEKIIEDKLIKYVREENKLEIAEKFIRVYPNSKFYENVIHIRNHLEFRKAEKANTIEAYTDFIKKYPEAAQIPEAFKARNELAFQNAKKINTIEAYNKFINEYPEAYHYYDAIKLRDQLAFDKAKKENSIESMEWFISQYPNSLHVPAAKIIQRKLLYERARQINTLEAYNDFISKYPDGEYFVDVFNLKTNVLGQNILKEAQGNTEMVKWIKGFDFDQQNDSAGCIVVTTDNKIVLSGTRHKKEGSGLEAWLIGIDGEGRTLWNRAFGSSTYNVVKTSVLTPENDILLGGWNGITPDTLNRRSWIFKVSANGNGQWERNVDGREITSLYLAPSKDVFVSGYDGADTLPKNLFLMKLNPDYNKLWSRNYIKQGNLSGMSVTQAQNLVLASGRWLWKTDQQGYIVWEKWLPSTDSIISVNLMPGGIFYMSGFRNNAPYIARINDQGAVSWEKTLTELQGYHCDFASVQPDKSLFARLQSPENLIYAVLNEKGERIKSLTFPKANSMINNSLVINGVGEVVATFTKLYGSNTEIVGCKFITK